MRTILYLDIGYFLYVGVQKVFPQIDSPLVSLLTTSYFITSRGIFLTKILDSNHLQRENIYVNTGNLPPSG